MPFFHSKKASVDITSFLQSTEKATQDMSGALSIESSPSLHNVTADRHVIPVRICSAGQSTDKATYYITFSRQYYLKRLTIEDIIIAYITQHVMCCPGQST